MTQMADREKLFIYSNVFSKLYSCFNIISINCRIMLLKLNSEKWNFDFVEQEYIGGEIQSKILCYV
jgi:hypothetical protein